MMKGFQKVLLLVSCLTVLSAPSAWAIGVDLFGAGTYTMGTGSPTPTSALGFPGGGLGLNFKLGQKVDLNISGLYLTSKYSVDDGIGGTTDVASTKIQAQLGFVFNLSRVFALDFGGHYNNYLKNDTGFSGTNDYGLQAGLNLRIPLGATAAFFIHPQYHYALSKFSSDDSSLTPNEFVGTVGFSFGMHSK